MIPDLAAGAGMSLDRANASFESLQNLAFLLGTPIAGLLVATLGARHVLWLDGGASLISALIVMLAIPAARFGPRAIAVGGRYWDELMAGLRFIRRDAVLWPMVIILAVTNGVTSATAGVLLPVYFRDTIGSPAALGVVYAAIGGGAFIGSMLFGIFARRVSRWAVWSVSYLLVPIEFWIFLISPSVAVLVGAFFVSGLLMGPINPLMVTLRHERSPSVIRGRVFSTYSAISMAVSPLGVLVAGNLVEGIGFNPTVLILGGVAQLAGVVSLFLPGLRQMNTSPPVSVVGSSAPMSM